jgi:hypothetical protein
MKQLFLFVSFLAAPAMAAEGGWQTYNDGDFEIDHPPASKSEKKQDKDFNCVRIQNAKNPSTKPHPMKEGEFLLEIFFVPKKSWGAKRGWPQCAERDDAKPDIADHRTAWRRGFEASKGDGYVDSICVQYDSEMYVINATWPSNHREEAQKVLHTFRRWRHAQ